MGGAPQVSICLLNYNGTSYVKECLAHLAQTRHPSTELIVVDNASTDGSREQLARLVSTNGLEGARFLPLETNRGFAAGHNAAARLARGEFLAFLNVTVEVEPGWLDLVPWMAGRPDVGFAQPVILTSGDPDRVQSMGSLMGRSGRLRVIGRGREMDRTVQGPPVEFDIFSVLGAAFVARTSAFRALGGFDESMFLFFEESDLCWRGWLTGWRSVCRYTPGQLDRVVHHIHGTVPRAVDVPQLFDRNRTVSMLRNFELTNLPFVAWNALVVASELSRRPRALYRYGREVGERFFSSVQRRREIQRARRVPDRVIFGLAAPPGLPGLR